MNFQERALDRTLRETMDRVFRLETLGIVLQDRLAKLENPSAMAWGKQAEATPASAFGSNHWRTI